MKQHDIDLDLSRPQVMAILNVTPDSFFAGSRMPDATHVERRVKEAAAEGASIIDVGGYSSRSGADEVPADEEWRRVELGIGAVRRLAPGVLISVDTFRSEVAARAIEKFGPLIINDISAGELDPQMPATAARYGVPYVAMHMKGDPRTMQTLTDYKRDITAEVTAYFETKTADLLAAGVERIAADRGLTPRETEALELLAHGRNAQAIQERMVVSRSTAKTHIRNVYAKLEVHSQQELIDAVELAAGDGTSPR